MGITPELLDCREELEALGIDPDIVVLPSGCSAGTEDRDKVRLCETEGELTDEEWTLICPLLPPEARQARTISNREFVNSVLWVFAGGRHWTQIAGDRGEAMRKRCARWAHAGVWQELHEDIKGRGLSPGRESQLLALAERARRLRAKVLAARVRP